MTGAHKAKPAGWLTTREACERLAITLRTLYKLIDTGQLPGYKIGRVIRVRQADVDDWLERARIQPGDLRHLYPHDEGGG